MKPLLYCLYIYALEIQWHLSSSLSISLFHNNILQTLTQLIFPKMGYKWSYCEGKITLFEGSHQGAALFARRLPKKRRQGLGEKERQRLFFAVVV
jgi:hypothetical protein